LADDAPLPLIYLFGSSGASAKMVRGAGMGTLPNAARGF